MIRHGDRVVKLEYEVLASGIWEDAGECEERTIIDLQEFNLLIPECSCLLTVLMATAWPQLSKKDQRYATLHSHGWITEGRAVEVDTIIARP